MHPLALNARIVDPVNGSIELSELTVEKGVIVDIRRTKKAVNALPGFLIPGFVDAHVHIESSMLLPTEFAVVALTHGTVATVSDPHEIANVCGVDGIEYLLRNSESSPLKFNYGVPSCVPATPMETSGAVLDAKSVSRLLDDPRMKYLSEVMNFPGVLSGDADVMAKLNAAKERSLPIDGHAPGLTGNQARRYFAHGISTDHECVTFAEAEEKIAAGARIAIREGSAARNFDALWPLIDQYPESCMFCSDDKHPDDLLVGHINRLASRAVNNGCNVMNVLRVACVNPVQHYGLNVGQLKIGDAADFVLVDDLSQFQVRETYVAGELVARDGRCLVEPTKVKGCVNNFTATQIEKDALLVKSAGKKIRVIEVLDGQLITPAVTATPYVIDGRLESDPKRDLLKLVVVNRYFDAPPAIAFIRGFGFQEGAIAQSVAHDSHNIVAVGVTDDEITRAINCVISMRGGLCLVHGEDFESLPLSVAGLMSTESCATVANRYAGLEKRAKTLGSSLRAPFMSLSFMALPVIPDLKLTDRGLFDVGKFEFVSLFLS